MKIDLNRNNIVRGDNIDWLNWISDESIDLCYIDPPYFSGEDRDIVWKNGAERRSFGDKFRGEVRYYMEWLTPRLELIHKKLKKTGSLFVQCDWHASHRIRCALDDIFGYSMFQNEIIWQKTSSSNDASTFGNKHDTIFFYSKSRNFNFHKQYENHQEKYKKKFRYKDEKGYFRDIPLTAKGLNGGGYNYEWKGKNGFWRCPIETMKKYDEEGSIYYSKNGTPYKKGYLEGNEKKAMQDVWLGIKCVNSQSHERIGYPTQKPESLIKIIVECASNPGDLVLDCFVGGGTTAKVCADLNRRFLVGDVSPVAVRMTATRLQKAGYIGITIKNLAKTKDQLLAMKGQDFEKFVAEARGWEHNGKSGGGDGNIDAMAPENIPVQIKNHRNPTGPADIKEFFGTLVAKGKNKGFFVAWEYTKKAREQVAKFNQDHGVEIVLMTCAEALESLLLDSNHHTLYEAIFNQLAPESWKTPTIQNSIDDAS